MHIITTIYCTEIKTDEKLPLVVDDPDEFPDLSQAERQWISIYEGKNRVLPMDRD